MGHDPGTTGKRSSIVERYRTGGTPWTILIDRAGVVRANEFHFAPEESIKLLDELLEETPPTG
jgi:hypothetical protein